ncbi:calcium/sodium antiporter [Planctomycetota bacterium]
MNIFWAIVLLVVGLVMLWKSADWMVDGAIGFAEQLGISALVIGLTIVAMGTSAPEVAASIAAAIQNKGNMALGNVYGSNIANLALVGGLCALIRPIQVKSSMIRREMPAMILVGLLLWPLLLNKELSRPEGAALLTIFAALIGATVYLARKNTENPKLTAEAKSQNTKKHLLLIVVGLAGLALGAKITVDGAVFIGREIGLNEAVIGLTIIAIGTSLPELITSLVAITKGQHDISIGNLVGSNIFNTLLVTGTAGVVRPFVVAARLTKIDYWIMITVTIVFVAMAILTKRIGRICGLILFSGYVAYMIYLLA